MLGNWNRQPSKNTLVIEEKPYIRHPYIIDLNVNTRVAIYFPLLCLMFLLSCSSTEVKKPNAAKMTEHLIVYTHVLVGFPPDTMDLTAYTDTLFLDADDGKVTPYSFYNLLDGYPRFQEGRTKRLKNGITRSSYSEHTQDFLAYYHVTYGLLYLARTDWEKHEFKLENHYKYPDSLWKPLLDTCLRLHNIRNLPPPLNAH
jgi:hypothetical protein